MTRFAVVLYVLLLLSPGMANARDAHESYLDLKVDNATVNGEWKIPLADLDAALQLDTDRNGDIVWQEMEPRRQDIESYLRSHLQILTNGVDPGLKFGKLIYGAQQGEPFILSELTIQAPGEVGRVDIECSLLAERYADYRSRLKIVWQGRGKHEALVSAQSGTLSFTRETASGAGFAELLQSGVWHIWIGYDHVLFLLVLLIPAVLRRTPTGREAVPDFAGAFARVTVIVSAFTIAHSITLTCAAMQWIVLPGRLVESAIAASVFIAAVLNFLPTTAGVRGAWLAFGFGLLHGFGFAGVLSEVDAAGAPLWRTLVAFNLGVEVGQLAIVATFLPIAFLLRNTRFYRTGVVYGGSSIAGLCALLWFVRRAFPS
jgi:hypothetical protein